MIADAEGVAFLQWCLPQLHLRWRGFRKVRRQLYKRLNRRLRELKLPTLAAYRNYLERHPVEWSKVDAFCRIPISRFYRDQRVFRCLEREILPELAEGALSRDEAELRCWCGGCSGGEEPYTIAVFWRQSLASRFPTLRLEIMATDVDPRAIRRAERGCYSASSLKELPGEWRRRAFVASREGFCLKNEFRSGVTFQVEDIRARMPDGPFDLILCRNLVFTYFDDRLQRETMDRLTDRLVPGGALIIGKLESLPEGRWKVEPWPRTPGIYRKLPR